MLAILIGSLLILSSAYLVIGTGPGAETKSAASSSSPVSNSTTTDSGATSSSFATTSVVPPANGSMALEVAFPNMTFSRMTFLTSPSDGTNRIFIIVQAGEIFVFPDATNASSPRTFLDIRSEVTDAGNEQGLLGMAFDPHYSTNGYFYVYYTAASGDRHAVVSRFSVSSGDPSAACCPCATTTLPNKPPLTKQSPNRNSFPNFNEFMKTVLLSF